ncbi:MAG TPA: hypothetical protein VHU23_01005 [Rhizomicrobium sp.]|jgi:hypothetical protein|nr:hypothetical protein [Rhizomicrobium sp.]
MSGDEFHSEQRSQKFATIHDLSIVRRGRALKEMLRRRLEIKKRATHAGRDGAAA